MSSLASRPQGHDETEHIGFSDTIGDLECCHTKQSSNTLFLECRGRLREGCGDQDGAEVEDRGGDGEGGRRYPRRRRLLLLILILVLVVIVVAILGRN